MAYTLYNDGMKRLCSCALENGLLLYSPMHGYAMLPMQGRLSLSVPVTVSFINERFSQRIASSTFIQYSCVYI